MSQQGRLEQELAGKRARLEAYLSRELYVLSPDGVQSYGVGSLNTRRYETALADLRAAIRALEGEIAELEGRLAGRTARRAVGVVPRDT